MLLKWEELPENMRTEEVRPYYEMLARRRVSLLLKRIFDILAALALMVILALPMLLIALAIKLDSDGPVFFRQERVTAYGRIFRIHKFRTMVDKADMIGPGVTVADDCRITKVGAVLRKYRMDEFPQVFDVLKGDMSFVGARPESVKYVDQYTPVMRATLLLPAGITSEASILFKDEAELLDRVIDTDRFYVERILPVKMDCCLKSIEEFSLFRELLTLFRTVYAVAEIEIDFTEVESFGLKDANRQPEPTRRAAA